MGTAVLKKKKRLAESLRLTDQDYQNAVKVLCEKKLRSFVPHAWRVVEPETEFVSGWHIDAICDHLQAVAEGKITRLIINIPPRHMKSLTVCVFWPAWMWIQKPEMRFLFSSYSEDLSVRDNVKCQRIILSNWYQRNWGNNFSIITANKSKLENNRMGYRLATSVCGMVTGEGGDAIIVDDPHNAQDITSAVKRDNVHRWWDEAMSSRLNNPKTGVRIIIMQRLHEEDLAGHILAKENDYVHLCLPARYESEQRTKTILDFADPRLFEGDPLWPAKFDCHSLSKLEKELGTYAAAGQLQQRPSPRGGGMFKKHNFVIIEELNPFYIQRVVRYWDKAGSYMKGKYTAGVKMAILKEGLPYQFVVLDVVRGRWEALERETIIKQTAQLDGKSVRVYLEQEGGSGGKESAQSTIRNLKGFICLAESVTDPKGVRAEPFAAQSEARNVAVLSKKWTEEYLDELKDFNPDIDTGFKDQVDASSGAFNKLNENTNRAGSWGAVKNNARVGSI